MTVKREAKSDPSVGMNGNWDPLVFLSSSGELLLILQ